MGRIFAYLNEEPRITSPSIEIALEKAREAALEDYEPWDEECEKVEEGVTAQLMALVGVHSGSCLWSLNASNTNEPSPNIRNPEHGMGI